MLSDQLHQLGWHVSSNRDGSDWVMDEASPALHQRGGSGQ
jgi:hypothetical protein